MSKESKEEHSQIFWLQIPKATGTCKHHVTIISPHNRHQFMQLSFLSNYNRLNHQSYTFRVPSTQSFSYNKLTVSVVVGLNQQHCGRNFCFWYLVVVICEIEIKDLAF
ncbi:hypothetical protein P8452_02664 [Trifolium repens]|nr:hypothetical protein P8452_02664 [Trifolium repens]